MPVSANLTGKDFHKGLTANNKWKRRLFFLFLHTFLLAVSEPIPINTGNPIDGIRMYASHLSITGIHSGNTKNNENCH